MTTGDSTAIRDPLHPDFDRHSAVLDSLVPASTVGRLDDWREAAATFLDHLQARGYDVRKDDPPVPVAAVEFRPRIGETLARLPFDGRTVPRVGEDVEIDDEAFEVSAVAWVIATEPGVETRQSVIVVLR